MFYDVRAEIIAMADGQIQKYEKKTRAWAKCSACRQRKGKVCRPQKLRQIVADCSGKRHSVTLQAETGTPRAKSVSTAQRTT